MSELNFVAVDVETANHKRGSICCIGVAEVAAGEVVRVEQWLTAPPPSLSTFNGINIGIHGIRPGDVVDAPSFSERFSQLLDVVGDRLVLAHNASFESSAFNEACRESGLPSPTWDLACSMHLAKAILPASSYKLDHLCRTLDIDLNHHQAGSDAEACARLTIHLARIAGTAEICDLVKSLSQNARKDRPSRNYRMSSFANFNEAPPDPNVDADLSHPLYGKTIVITGTLSITRDAYWEAIAAVGGIVEERVTKRTNVLVCGDEAQGLRPIISNKHARALDLKANGLPIEILREDELADLLDFDFRSIVGEIPEHWEKSE